MISTIGMNIVMIATAWRNKKTKLQICIMIASWPTIDILNTTCLRARGANYFIQPVDIADPLGTLIQPSVQIKSCTYLQNFLSQFNLTFQCCGFNPRPGTFLNFLLPFLISNPFLHKNLRRNCKRKFLIPCILFDLSKKNLLLCSEFWGPKPENCQTIIVSKSKCLSFLTLSLAIRSE